MAGKTANGAYILHVFIRKITPSPLFQLNLRWPDAKQDLILIIPPLYRREVARTLQNKINWFGVTAHGRKADQKLTSSSVPS
mmetsp:Transcript_29327/g.75598  ORF Transcript_29327/g.75598 Transcript_29327/m.75598 type:complete len:82 (+) Transcript_29327:432-677(+)